MNTSRQVNGKNSVVKGVIVMILLLATLFVTTACEKSDGNNNVTGESQSSKSTNVDWDANIYSLDGVDPSSVNGSYVLKEVPGSEGDYDAGFYDSEEIILWDGKYIHISHEVLITPDIDHPVFYDSDINDKGYYILRDNGTLTLIEEDDDQIRMKAFYYFEDNNLVIEYYGAGLEITKEVYVKQ